MAKQLTIEDFQNLGYLQELNRTFLHPLGLSLGISIDDKGEKQLYAIFDHRDEKSGPVFKAGQLSQEKVDFVEAQRKERNQVRLNQYGFDIQPVE
jgi:hypothetical protein